jgi:RNA polymerase sigma factor (sigma-70 family)
MPRRLPPPLAALGWPMRAVRYASPKERRVGDEEQDARYAERRAALEREFAALPVPGTDAYWAALTALTVPMEVLARCLRQRLKAGDNQAADRIYRQMVQRSETVNQYWLRQTLRRVSREQAAELAQDLMQELAIALWQELKGEHTFIEVSFGSVLHRLQQHVATTYMQREGHWQRKGVATPERVPRRLIESLTPPEEGDGGESGVAPRQLPADPKAETAFTALEAAEAVQELLDILPPHLRELAYLLTYGDELTQEELAAHFGITDRAIRLRIEKARAILRAHFNQRGGPHD